MFKKILLPVDIDYPKTAAAVYQKAKAIAKFSGAELRLVSIMPGFSMPLVASYIPDDVRNEAADRFKNTLETFIKNNCDESVSYTIGTGKNWEQVLKTAKKWNADLIIVYHNHRRDLNEMFSRSCSARVADKAECSVLRIRNIKI